jgi:hypothetical protein
VHAARNGRGGVEIERCHGAPIKLQGRGGARDFDVRGGVLTWDSGHPGVDAKERVEGDGLKQSELQHGVLFSYNLATHHRRSWALPRLPLWVESKEGKPITGAFGYSTHTTTTVFWIAARRRECIGDSVCSEPEVFSVYAATQ